MSGPTLSIGPRLEAALNDKAPVVALESTIITHGMPYPQNLETALAVEATVRSVGAEPATTAILDGSLCVGVEGGDLERLAKAGPSAAKASLRDVAALTARGSMAGTTVATTMQIAAMAGIPIFATGGIGGVHRGADQTFDISADLTQLARSKVAVICAGAKSILDIPKTLEVLETQGVPVLGFGTDMFPAFFCRSSGLPVDYRFDTAKDVANVIKRHFALPSSGGVVVGNPVPATEALDSDETSAIVAAAVEEADENGVAGKDITPFLLQRIVERTDGRSLTANIALIKHNARLGAEIAVALARGDA